VPPHLDVVRRTKRAETGAPDLGVDALAAAVALPGEVGPKM
jgi:hypothetical protein